MFCRGKNYCVGKEEFFPAQGIFKVPLRFDEKPGSEYPSPRKAFHKPCQDFFDNADEDPAPTLLLKSKSWHLLIPVNSVCLSPHR